MTETYPLRAAVLAQLGGGLAIAFVAWGLLRVAQVDPWKIAVLLAMLQGAVAAMIALRQGAPSWWLWIHLGFAPLVVFVHGLEIDPLWFLGLFLLLLLVFWRTDQSRVPLYLSNKATALALARLIPKGACRVIDLGCGEAGLLRHLAGLRRDCNFVGIEHAPLTWAVARLRTLHIPNLRVRYGNFWNEPLDRYRLVYAFLSPAPMARLWEKASREMTAESRLVSNSFPVPDIEASGCIEVDDRRATRLYVYAPPAR